MLEDTAAAHAESGAVGKMLVIVAEEARV